jgi:hypothetical protein
MAVIEVEQDLVGLDLGDVDFVDLLAVLFSGVFREGQALDDGWPGGVGSETASPKNSISDS